MLTFNDKKRIANLKVLEQRTPEKQKDLKNTLKCEVHRIKVESHEKKYSGVNEVK